eukprot:Skav220019  [mRNA]  locus=scaffold3413:75129:76842:- [translate_table: standard]
MKGHLASWQLWIEAKPGTYALIGACAMLAGTARITISLAMILMETMGEAEFGLPIALAVMVRGVSRGFAGTPPGDRDT